MRPILLDTNAYAAFKRGDSAILDIIQSAEVIGISPIMLGELLSGFDTGSKAKQNRIELQQFLESERVKIYPLTADTANFFSRIYAALKLKGRPIPTNDMWIAAQALEQGCVVCTYDKHFQEIEGLVAGSILSDITL
jgi:tRNA(fMet)-specific endonuclease VapC